ncbi:MAG: alpha/beta fold hydrolase [Betaproteobacteria bacterium]|nr:alpha/beta fold hydrolase [Betaproteobacteria bacterium]
MKRQTVLRRVFAIGAIAFFAYTGFKLESGANRAQLAAPIATDAKAFTLGTLHFTACELPQEHSGATTTAFCAPFSVPENRADPDGRKINLRLALIKSDAPKANRDIVVYLAGGPGQSAIDTWPQMAAALAPLRKHRHILLLDQRGTGGSNALTCTSDDDDRADRGRLDIAKIREHTRDCLLAVERRADPRDYTTTAAVEDLEAVRQSLGAPPFDLIGVSYGTRVAQQYVMHHPQGARSVVLDSVVPNQLVLGEDFAQNLDAALNAQFSRCTHTPACAKAFGDPYASLIKLRDQLRARPQTWDYRDPVTFAPAHRRLDDAGLASLVRLFAYTPETAALLPLSISEGLKGDFAPLAGQEKLLADDLADLSGNAMQLSVVCSEDADLLTPRPQDADTMLGTRLIDLLTAACEIWPHGTRPAGFHAALETKAPVLILEGELDPVTPPRYGKQVLEGLSDGRLLVAKGQGHNVIGRGCIPKLVAEFVDKLDPKRLDAKCVDDLGPTPAYIDFNGSSP